MKVKPVESTVTEVDMTPMIDIVFQLISFFMIITNFEQTKADERVKLPKDTLAKPPEVKRESELMINFGFLRDKEGNKLDQEPFVFYLDENFRLPEFPKSLLQEARIFREGGTDPKKVTVTIRADSEVPTGMVQALIKMSQEAGFEKFALKATQRALQ
jgi:biopolymer transport protein ExbD